MLVGAPCKQGNTYDRTLLALLKILQLLPTMYFFQKEAVKIMVINKIYKKKRHANTHGVRKRICNPGNNEKLPPLQNDNF